MIFVIAVVGATLFSYSVAQPHNEPMNVIVWDKVGQYYNNWTGPDVDHFSAMPDDHRRELCCAVRNAPKFVYTSNNDVEIIRGGVRYTDSIVSIQKTTVLIDGYTDVRTIMLCELENDATFYLGKNNNDYTGSYLLFVTSERNERPQLRAMVMYDIKLQWTDGSWLYPHKSFGKELQEAIDTFCWMEVQEMLNLCASVHRSKVNYDANRSFYIVELEPPPYNHCKEQTIETFFESHFSDLQIRVATCILTNLNDNLLRTTYRLTPHPTDILNTTFIVTPDEPKERCKDRVSITAKVERI